MKGCSSLIPVKVSVSMQAHRHVLPLKSEVISGLRSSLSTPSLAQCIEELVFNSLDAKATCIAVRVDLENYRIQVVDNGCGIISSDLSLVGQRYATSKCYGLEDLNTLAFFGFRGEFLASLSNISSVLEVISRPKGTKTTFSKLFQKGEVYEISEAKDIRPSHGTTVTAYNVFYNLPVRQKKISVALDLEKIRKRLEAFAIIHHDVSISLRDDLSGSKIFQTHITLSPKSAFGFLFGHPKANNLKEIANSYRNFSVSGYLGTEGHANKNLQYIYVNKKLVLKTKLHKQVNHFLSRSLLLKPPKFGKNPDSPLTLDSSSHCQQSSPPKGQGENAIYILDIKCLRSEYDIQYDNYQTFLEFQDWKGVSVCLEQALQQFLVNENLCLISEEGKDTKKKDEAFIEDSSDESSSENEEVLSQPPPTQLAKLQKYGYNISTRNCTNNLQSRVVTRAHLRGKTKTYSVDKKEPKANEKRVNESADPEDLEEVPKKLKTDLESGELHSADLLLLNNDESFICNTKEIQQHADKVQTNLSQKDEEPTEADAEEERDSRVLIPEVSSYSKSTVQEDSESIPLMMPSCASTLSAGGDNSLKISEDSCSDKQTLRQETTFLSQNVCADNGHKKISEKGGQQLHEKNADQVSFLYTCEIVASEDRTSGCNSRKGPVKCGPTTSFALSNCTNVTAPRDKVIPSTTRGEVSFGCEQVGSSPEDNSSLSKEDSNQKSLSCQHCEVKAVNEEDSCMVICEADSHKSDSTVHVNKRVRFESLEGSNHDSDVHKVPLGLEKNERGRSNDSLQDDGRKVQRKEHSQDENTAGIEIQPTSTYMSSLQRFKNGLKSRPVNVASNLAAKISDALNKAKAQNAIFCANSMNRDTTSHLSRMRSHFFPVTENNLPVDIRDAPSIRLSQKLAWLKKCKPSEKDNCTTLKEDSPSLEQSLVKDFYTERKSLSGIQRKGLSEYKEMVRCQRRSKLDAISDQCISHASVSFRTSSEQMNRSEISLEGINMPCKIQNCSLPDPLSSKCSLCQSNSGKDVEAPVFSNQPQIYSGHVTQESSDSHLVNRALPKCFEVHGDLPEKPWFKNTNSKNELNPDCRLCSHGFMSTESFIQPARDLLPCKNLGGAKLAEDLLATCSSTNFVNKREVTMGNFVDGVERGLFQDHQKYLDRGPPVIEEIKSYTGLQSSYKITTSEDNGNSFSETMSLSDVKAMSEARHKEILSKIDDPSLLSPEKERQAGNDIYSPLVSDSGDEVPFSCYKDSPFQEMPSTQPFHVQNSPVEGVKVSERQIETFGQFLCQKEDNEEEGKSCESLKMGHVSPSEPCELQIVGNERSLNKFSEVLPTVQGEELATSTKDKLSSEEGNSASSPCHMDVNWNMFEEDHTDLLTVLDNLSMPHAPKMRSDVQNKSLPYRKDTQLQTDLVATDVSEHAGPHHDDKVTALQKGVDEPCVGTARKDDLKINDSSEVSTRVILRDDHTIAIEKANSEHPLQQKMLCNESKQSDGHLETSTGKTGEAGVHNQKECDPPNQQNFTREKVAQPCSTEVSSTTDGQGLDSTEKSHAMKKVCNPIPWELYWFLPKTAKPFFPRPLQDRHLAPEKTASLHSAHLVDEFLKEENEMSALHSKWKHGIPNLDKEDCRSFDELFDNWQNPVFKTNDADVSDSCATRSISATVKVHNSLHPYQFTKEIFETIEVIGQVDKKFIVCQVSTSVQKRTDTKPHLLVLIDQHAAHERIRLEQLTQEAYIDSDEDSDAEDTSSSYLQDTTVPHLRSCQVIPPIPINITDEECRLAQAFSQKLKRFGVTVSISKSRKGYRAKVTELPACMVEREANMVKKARQTVAADLAEALVQESIQQLQDAAGSCASLPRTITKILNSQACRGAIKFGDPLTLDEILSLLSQLSECKLPFQCAHGRPSMIPLLDFNHLTAKLNSQDTHSHHPKVNLKRLRHKRIKMVDSDETKT